MGRPLNKKYFGNRNIGTTGITDDKIGGEGLAAFTLGAGLGSVNINTTTANRNFPVLTIPAPTIANGVQATKTVVWEINTITLTTPGSGYDINLSAAAIDSISGSIWTAASVTPAITISTNGSGVPTAVALGANRGEWTTINGTGITTWSVVKGAGNNAQITVTFRLKSITTLDKGSGYVSAPTLTWVTGNTGTLPDVPTVALTADSGNVGSSTNQENAILAWAYTGGSLYAVDLQKQISSKRYRFNKAGEVSRVGTEIGRIKYTGIADGTSGYTAAEGVELNIVAKDSHGGTYLVRKLNNHTCTLYPMIINSSTGIVAVTTSAGTEFTAGHQVKWTFGAPTNLDTVQILNA